MVERSHGSFYRSFRVPGRVDHAALTAEHKDGVLRVVLPLEPEAKPREIPVQAG